MMTGEMNKKDEVVSDNLAVDIGGEWRYDGNVENEFLNSISSIILGYAQYMKTNNIEVEGQNNE